MDSVASVGAAVVIASSVVGTVIASVVTAAVFSVKVTLLQPDKTLITAADKRASCFLMGFPPCQLLLRKFLSVIILAKISPRGSAATMRTAFVSHRPPVAISLRAM